MGTLVDFADRLRERIDIVDVVGGYVSLRRAGSNYKGLCPFHREKTPSFTVSQTKQMFHCFGCQTGGDVFRFVQLVEHVDWKDAVRILAERYGVPFPERGRGGRGDSRDHKKILYDINELATQHFARHLASALSSKRHPATAYFARRAMTPQIIEQFRLGLASEGWTDLLEAAQRSGYSPEQVQAAGLAIRHAESGRLYDRFRDRIVFPICDHLGRPVAFGARLYRPDASPDQPKYINSPETELYKKGQYLYGFHLAKEAISRSGTAILVEGYFDVLRAHLHGFTHAVASCGTALTLDQARALRRVCRRIVFVYDGDEAGQKAMLRGCEVLLECDIAISVVVLPDGHDPDSFLQEFGSEAFQRRLDAAVDFYDFFLETAVSRFGVHSVGGKVQAFNFLLPILKKISNEIARHAYLTRTAEVLGVDDAALRRELAKHLGGPSAAARPSIVVSSSMPPRVERQILKLCIENETLQFEVFSRIPPEWLTDALLRKWYSICRDRVLDGLPIDWTSLLSLCDSPDGEDARLLRTLALEEGEPPECIDVAAIDNVAARLERDYIIRENRVLEEMCRTLYPEDPDGERWMHLMEELNGRLPRLSSATRACRPDPGIWRNSGAT